MDARLGPAEAIGRVGQTLGHLLNKRERGFERLLYPLGADHLVYVRELKAAMAALGGDPEMIEAPIAIRKALRALRNAFCTTGG